MKIEYIRINEHFEPHFTVDNLVKVDEVVKETPEGDFRLTTYEAEGMKFYSFGLMVKDIGQRPLHGGEWSSNEGSINRVFGLNLTGAPVKNLAGKYPDQYFSMSTDVGNIPIPKTLKKGKCRFGIYDLFLIEKGDKKFPGSRGYFNSTTVGEDGRIISPTIEGLKKLLNEDNVSKYWGEGFRASLKKDIEFLRDF